VVRGAWCVRPRLTYLLLVVAMPLLYLSNYSATLQTLDTPIVNPQLSSN